MVAVIGANGAGKTTLLRTLAGAGPRAQGHVEFAGRSVGGLSAEALARRGLVLVPEGRKIFPSLSVEENLQVGAYCGRPGPWTIERVHGLFPILRERRRERGTNLSGGEQQMLAIGRGLMANPRVLLVDEISLGLSPLVVQRLYEVLTAVRREGTTLVVVEQDVSQVLAVAHHVYCLRRGAISLDGLPQDLDRAQIAAAYFGS